MWAAGPTMSPEPADELRWSDLAAPGDVAAVDRLFEEWTAEEAYAS